MKIISFIHSGEHVPPQLAVSIRQHFGGDVVVVPSATEWEETTSSLEECCGDVAFCPDGDLLSELEDASSQLCSGVRRGDVVIVPCGQNVADFLVRRSVIDTVKLVEDDDDQFDQFADVRVFGHTADRKLVQLYPKV